MTRFTPNLKLNLKLKQYLAPYEWRTVDVVVAAVIAVAFGVVFWAWAQFYDTTSAAFSSIPAAQGIMAGMWLVPGVLGALVIRKPGALPCSASWSRRSSRC